jgi:hypothetical protein
VRESAGRAAMTKRLATRILVVERKDCVRMMYAKVSRYNDERRVLVKVYC